MIFNSFKYSLISSSLDGTEDGKFRGYEDIEKGNEIIKIDNDDVLYLDEWLCWKHLFWWTIIFLKF